MFELSILRAIAFLTAALLVSGGLLAQVRDVNNGGPRLADPVKISLPDDDDEDGDDAWCNPDPPCFDVDNRERRAGVGVVRQHRLRRPDQDRQDRRVRRHPAGHGL